MAKAKHKSVPTHGPLDHLREQQMPSSADAERAILGAMLLDNDAYHSGVVRGLRTDYFALDSHRRIFAAMELLMADSKPIDFVTIHQVLDRNKEVEAVGGVAYVTCLTDGLPRVKNIDQYVDIVTEKHMYRQVIHVCTSLIQSAYDQSDTAKDLLSIAQDKISLIQSNERKSGGFRIGEYIRDVYEDLKQLALCDRDILGLTTGVEEVDEATTGIRDAEGEYWIFGGFTSSGKSSLAGQCATCNTMQEVPVKYFTPEMQKEVIAHRVWAFVSDVEYRKFRMPKHLRNTDFEKMDQTLPIMDSIPFYVDDAELDIGELIARAHAAIRKHKVRLTVVDYIQLVNAAAAATTKDRVTLVSRCLRSLAKTTKTGVIGVSQLSRPANADVNMRPSKHMLKESGDVENDAHAIVLTYMPVDKETNTPTGDDELIIAKQRAGPIGTEKVQYDKQTLSFRARNWRDVYEKEEKQLTMGIGK